MSALFDDVSRILAGPSSRRQAFRLVGGALGGAVLTTLGLGRASLGWGALVGNSQASDLGVTCPTGQKVCGSGFFRKCCSSTQHCCVNNLGAKCCNTRYCLINCCQSVCCDGKGPCCCSEPANCFCCPLGKTCGPGICR